MENPSETSLFLKKLWARKGLCLSLLLIASLSFVSWHYVHKAYTFRKKSKFYRAFYYRFKEQPIQHSSLSKTLTLPLQLKNLPLGQTTGMVIGAKKIQIRGVQAPYNPSLIENGKGGYHLFFRHDVIDGRAMGSFYSYIGCAELDENFNQTEKEYFNVDTQSEYSEDPRVLKVGDQLYLVFNDLIPQTISTSSHNAHCRGMCVGPLDLKNRRVKYVNHLDLHLSPVEKNWAPFEFAGSGASPQLHFEYSFFPHKILGLPDPSVNVLTNLTISDSPPIQSLVWPSTIWGTPRGGTPAQKIDGEYLSFFHSSFSDKDGIRWYVIGAYTFEAQPPFRVTKVSNFPILFEGMYDSPPLNTSNPHLRCLFPSGFAVEKKNGKELIHITCGENDAAVKVLTLDKEELMKSLKKV